MTPIRGAPGLRAQAALGLVLLLLGAFPLACQAQNRSRDPVSQELRDLKAEYDAFVKDHPPEAFTPSHPLIRIKNGLVLIDASATGDAAALLAELQALGLEGGAAYGNMVSGSLPITAIDDLEDLEHLRFVRASMGSTRGALSPEQVPQRFTLKPN